jgi:PAS domain S-box-containing protein
MVLTRPRIDAAMSVCPRGARRAVVVACLTFWVAAFMPFAAAAQTEFAGFLGRHIEYLDAKDDSPELSWAVDPARAGDWRKGEKDVLSFGVWREAAWLRFRLNARDQPLYLILRNARTEKVVLYRPSESGFEISQAGMIGLAGKDALVFRYPAFKLAPRDGTESVVYLRVENRGALRLDLRLLSADAFRDLETIDHLILGLMFGALGAVALYAFLAWRSLDERASLLLSVFVAALTSYLGYQTGILPLIVGSGGAAVLGLVAAIAATIAGSLFGAEFLGLKSTHPRLYRSVLAYAALTLVYLPLYSLNGRWSLAVFPFHVVAGGSLHLFVGWKSWRDGGSAGRDWLIGWATILMAVVSHGLIEMRIVPLNALTSNLIYIGVVVGSLTFAAALSRTHRRRRDDIVRTLRDSQERFALASRGAYDGLFDIDLAGDKAYFAPRLNELLGLADGALGTSVSALPDRILPEDRPVFNANIVQTMKAKRRRFEGQYRFRRGDGEIRWMAVRSLVVYGPTGRAIRQVGSIRDITEARRSNERLTDAIRSIADGFALFGPGDRLAACNEAFAGLYGASPADLRGKSFAEIIEAAATLSFGDGQDSDKRRAWIAHRMAVHRAADGKSIETRFENGRHYRITERRTSDGGTVLLRTDVTELVDALANAKAGEERIRNILDSLPARVAMVGRDRRFRFVNRQYCDAYGLAPDQIVGRPVADIIGSDALGSRTGLGDRALAGETLHAEDWVPYARIGLRYVLRVYTPSRSVDGAIDGFYVFAIDLTAQKEAEKSHREAEELRRTFVESAVDGFIAMDADGKIVEFNPAAEAIFRIPRDKAVGAELASLILPERFRDAHRNGLARIARTGQSELLGRTIEVPGMRADGSEFPAELTLTASRFAGKPYYSAFLRDITQRRELERQLLQSQKMEALGQLAGGVAHDFNNVLSVIGGYAALARRLAGKESVLAGHLGRIVEGVARAAGMTRELLVFGRKSSVHAKVVDIRRLLSDQKSMLAPLLGAQVNLTVTADGPPIAVEIDPNVFAQVIMNLAINARDAMPEGGPIDISVAPLNDSMVRLSVADRGTGMDEATQRRIFEPFFTTKAPGAGTGLGLAMVYGIVTQAGGKIAVDSAPGRGTRIDIDLPVSKKPVEKDAVDAASGASGASGSGRVVLIAEDEAMLRDVLVQTLEQAGYKVLAAANGVEALEILDALENQDGPERKPLDLLLTDLVMPELGGVKLASLAGELRPGLPVVFMTGYPSRGGFKSSDLPGDATVLAKPIDIDHLTAVVAKAIEKSGT